MLCWDIVFGLLKSFTIIYVVAFNRNISFNDSFLWDRDRDIKSFKNFKTLFFQRNFKNKTAIFGMFIGLVDILLVLAIVCAFFVFCLLFVCLYVYCFSSNTTKSNFKFVVSEESPFYAKTVFQFLNQRSLFS